MKAKRIAGTVAIAVISALLALFVYAKYFDKPVVVVDRGNVMEQTGKLTTSKFVPEGIVDFTDVAGKVVHAVVHVKTQTVQQYARNPIMEYFYGESGRTERTVRGYGSGVIVSPDGFIITNNHVIEDADVVDVTLNDKRTFSAKVIGRDPSTDIALIKIDAKDMPYIGYGDSDELLLGEWVLAIGNPFNLTSTVTAGIVSATGRSLGLLSDRYRVESFIQTDAALNVGNSGGALVNTRGQLVGITTAILSPSGTYAGNSFAVPVNIVKKVVEDLQEFGEVQRAIIGVEIGDVTSEFAEEKKLDKVKGVVIGGITEGGAAEEAGLKIEDVIVKIDNRDMDNSAHLQEYISKKRPGDKVKVTVLRNGSTKGFDIVLRNLDGNTSIVKAGEGAGVIFGARLTPLSREDRSKYGLDGGMMVVSVQSGVFDDMGIRKGYIITEINGESVKTIDDVKEVTDDGSDLFSIKGYQTNGTYFSYRFRQ
ncbi:MAG: trypsin-like peptidase domain-containing protein [Marinilabiliaceae bacterium]|jgi:Do/DeqQ family serine protease|nr:trypsin-like peptidase domain-containing protein [Marinilabiliaceae bacterium]